MINKNKCKEDQSIDVSVLLNSCTIWTLMKHLKKKLGLVSLVFLINGISTFVGYLMPKPFFLKNSSGTIQPIDGRIRRFIPFSRVFVQK